MKLQTVSFSAIANTSKTVLYCNKSIYSKWQLILAWLSIEKNLFQHGSLHSTYPNAEKSSFPTFLIFYPLNWKNKLRSNFYNNPNTLVLLPSFFLWLALVSCNNTNATYPLSTNTLCSFNIQLPQLKDLPTSSLKKQIGSGYLTITTTDSLAQQWFNQGLNLLHTFWHLEAYRAFQKVIEFSSKHSIDLLENFHVSIYSRLANMKDTLRPNLLIIQQMSQSI